MKLDLKPFSLAILLLADPAEGIGCPFKDVGHDAHVIKKYGDRRLKKDAGGLSSSFPRGIDKEAYGKALSSLDWDAVKYDLRNLFKDSKDFWPADYGHYGGLFLRHAWHCAGSYRKTDGRGGCDGGNQRFDPERSWPDNVNLDKAKRLLEPINLKYGLGLSWGDLMILAGNEAIRDMGGQVLGFCAGRIDSIDNSQTLLLGPTPEQEKFAPCPVQGDCPFPLGTNTLGLIYVNPEGPMGEPDPIGAADTIREIFGRMGLDDREIVSFIGGGHTFGKAHGACPSGPGAPPNEDELHPWPGNCGTGKGQDTFTSGFEGAWKSNPIQWDNDYMKNLRDYEWEPYIGPGGHTQWRVKDGETPQAPVAHPSGSNETQDIMMLTTDVALKLDPIYNIYVEEFADDEKVFADAFAKIWYQITSRDMGPITRCAGPDIPEAQAFQNPLPDPPSNLANMDEVEGELDQLMNEVDGDFVRLAWQCASTFRTTDYLGGCNGARIRFPPGSTWETNKGLDYTLYLLESIKEDFGTSLSWADLIVLAGNVALKRSGGPKHLPFCPGRTDASDGKGWDNIAWGNSEPPKSIDDLIEINERRGLSNKELVVLTWISSNTELSTKYLHEILASDECNDVVSCGLKHRPELRVWAEYYVEAGDDVFVENFAAAWTKMMNADRFDGPLGNVCNEESMSLSVSGSESCD